ncbi:MAG: DsrE family protein [Azospirillaceae bacterium]
MSEAGAAPRPGLTLVVQDGRFERVHYALVLASAAAAIGRPALLFFTGRALAALAPKGWRRLDGDPEGQEARLAERRVATFAELLEACRDLDVRIVACEMGLRAEAMAPDDLDPALGVEIAGAVTMLEATPAGAQMVMV